MKTFAGWICFFSFLWMGKDTLTLKLVTRGKPIKLLAVNLHVSNGVGR